MALQIRRGTDAERTAGGGVVFANGELVYVTDTDKLYIGDGATAGGLPLAGSAIASIGEYIVADTINSTLDLQQNLDLNGKDIIGTGNINIAGTINATGNVTIGDDASTDTVDFGAKITSSLTPNADSTYDIGATNARWNNGYFTGLAVDGQIDAVAINADVIADNSTVMVDKSSNTLTGDLTGDVTGDTAGTHTGAVVGNVTGDVTGDTAGTHTGAVVGNVTGDVTGDVVGNVTGNVVGDLTGDVTGAIKGSGGSTVLASNTGPADANLSVDAVTATTLSGTLTGNVTGDLTGDSAGTHTGAVTGDVTGNVTGNVTGDLTGNSAGVHTGNVTGDLTGNVTGNVAGEVTGNVFTSLIDSTDSSAITITPAVVMSSDLTVDNAISVGGITGVVINDNFIGAYSASNPTKLAVNTICSDSNDYTTELVIDNNVLLNYDMTVTGKLQAFGERAITAIHRTELNETNSGFFVTEYSGSVTDANELQDISNYTIKTKIVEDVADFGTAVKFASMTTTQRNALTAAAGMVVFNTTDTKLQVYTGSAWEDLH
jgi:hypothetical protein